MTPSTLSTIFGYLISHLIVTVLAAQPRVMPIDPSKLPSFTPERSYMEEMQMNKWASIFSKFEPDLVKRRLTSCLAKRRSSLNDLVDEPSKGVVDSIKFLTYRFRSQWPTPNSPVSDYTTQYPTYLFTIQVNDDGEFWHLKIIDLNRCCSIKKNIQEGQQNHLGDDEDEAEETGTGRLKKYQIVGLKLQKTRDRAGPLADFFDNDCPPLMMVSP